MDIQQYIESGLLEAYLLDALSTEEKAQVEFDLAESKELQVAFLQLEFEMEQLAYVLEKSPSKSVWDKIEHSLETKSSVDLPKTETEPIPIKKEISNLKLWRTWAIAATVSSIMFLYLWQTTEIQRMSLSDQFEQVKQELSRSEAENTHFASMQKMLLDPDCEFIKLDASDKKMPYLARVMWNNKTGEVMVSAETIPDLSEEQDLQLWALVDGKPINAGVITLNNENLSKQKMSVSKADVFAVTIEPKGGSAEPTLSNLILISKAQS